ncbi:MAG: MBL fold metallo-hydrolase [Deltaproteobacteria bacterium]|nr:MBL fold metallo-hydrolase [Deltaproteobacteria bacterium]MBW2121989.1 MBL fold metallo-hydrolase [Deltaproteobacteria bacterium]
MAGRVRITILCENTVGARIGSAEHGFSAYVETAGGEWLFDTGSGRFLVDNALCFRKDLTRVSKIFLSHGHYDHTGGLPQVLTLKGDVEVHAHPDVFLDRIALPEQEGGRVRYVGLPYRRPYLEGLGAQFTLAAEFLEVAEGVFLTGEVPRTTPFEKPDLRLQSKTGQTYQLDRFKDDQSLVIDTAQGLVIVFGCAHSGMINIIHHAIKKTGKDRIRGLIGGTHLDFLGPEQLEASIRALQELQVASIGVSHCTGLRAAARLSQVFGDRFRYGHVGAVFEF